MATQPEPGSLLMTLRRAAACACLVLLAVAAACSQPISAADFAIGIGADVTALDPHYHNVTPNNNAAAHVFVRARRVAR